MEFEKLRSSQNLT